MAAGEPLFPGALRKLSIACWISQLVGHIVRREVNFHDLGHDDIHFYSRARRAEPRGGLLAGKRLDAWTAIFLASTVATSVTGFGFPFHRFLPPHYVGVISLVVLALALVARYAFHLSGAWRWIYVVSAVIALYLNVFVAVVQAFQKVPALKAIAPTQTEPPFVIAQLAVLVLFVVLAIVATIRFAPGRLRTV